MRKLLLAFAAIAAVLGTKASEDIVVEDGELPVSGTTEYNSLTLKGSSRVTIAKGAKLTIAGLIVVAEGADAAIRVEGAATVSFFQLRNDSAIPLQWDIQAETCTIDMSESSWNKSRILKGNSGNGGVVFDVSEGAKLLYDLSYRDNETINAAGAPVVIKGAGDVQFKKSASGDYGCHLNEGAIVMNSGWVTVGKNVRLNFKTGSALNGISKLVTADANCIVDFENAGITNVVGTVDMGKGTLMGINTATLKVDCADEEHDFKANIPMSATGVTVLKTGVNDLIVQATTNLNKIIIAEGCVKVASVCRVGTCIEENGGRIEALGSGEILMDFASTPVWHGAGLGGIRKVGPGDVVLYDPSSLTGSIHIEDGSLVVSKYGRSEKFWRWTFKQSEKEGSPVNIGEIWMWNTDGSSSDAGLKSFSSVISGDDATALSKGYAAWGCDVTYNDSAASYQKSIKYFYDRTEGYNHVPYLATPTPIFSEESTWLKVVVRLTDEAKPVTGYDFFRYASYYGGLFPTAWKLEASTDGMNWVVADEKSAVTIPSVGKYDHVWLGGTRQTKDDSTAKRYSPKQNTMFELANYVSGGLSAETVHQLSVEVDEGAVLNLGGYGTTDVISGLTVNLAGAGTVKGGGFAPNGILSVRTPNRDGKVSGGQTLPLKINSVADLENLKSWTVVVDGRVRESYRVRIDGTRVGIETPGLILFMR